MTAIAKDSIEKMSIPELVKEIAKQKKQAQLLKVQLRTLQSKDHKSFKEAKLNISRLSTELTRKQSQEQAVETEKELTTEAN
jgi:ribosomal protein L29